MRASLYCSFCYLFDTSHFFFLLKKKTPMTNMPSNPKTTGKMLAIEKSSISKTVAITIKITPTKSAIFWNIILHFLISSRTLYRISLKRANRLSAGACYIHQHYNGGSLSRSYHRISPLYLQFFCIFRIRTVIACHNLCSIYAPCYLFRICTEPYSTTRLLVSAPLFKVILRTKLFYNSPKM
jgi:hypothetical protein